jgi:hypothetical protein
LRGGKIKKAGGQERTKFRGRERVGWTFAATAFIWLGCRSFWKPPREGSCELPMIGGSRIVEADL